MSTPLNAVHYRVYTAAGTFVTEAIAPWPFHELLQHELTVRVRQEQGHRGKFLISLLSKNVIAYEALDIPVES